MALQTPISSSRSTLEVDAIAVPGLRSFSGLGAEGTIAQTTTGAANQLKKHMAGFKWTPGRASTGIAMGKALYTWVKTALGGAGVSRNGAFKLADQNGRVREVRSFSHAMLTEFSVPDMDASSREAGLFGFAFEAEIVTWALGGGAALPMATASPKSWISSNFKITIGDLPCARVAKIDGFTWRCPVAPGDGIRIASVAPGAIPSQASRATVPDLTLSISAADHPAWQAAAKKWFVDGASLEANEMRGRISLLGPTLRDSDELGAIDLFNVGFKRFDPESTATGDQLSRFTVVLYVERMALSIKEYDA